MITRLLSWIKSWFVKKPKLIGKPYDATQTVWYITMKQMFPDLKTRHPGYPAYAVTVEPEGESQWGAWTVVSRKQYEELRQSMNYNR